MRGGFGGRVGLAGRGGFGHDRALLLCYEPLCAFPGSLSLSWDQKFGLRVKGLQDCLAVGGLTGFFGEWGGMLPVRRCEGPGAPSMLLNHVGDRGQPATGFPMHLAGE